MKLTALLLAFLPTLIIAKCFTTGETWDRQLAPSAINRACKELAGDLRRGQTKVKKNEPKKGQCYVFEVEHIGGAGSRRITEDECRRGMNRELSGCDRGGKTSYTDLTYT